MNTHISGRVPLINIENKSEASDIQATERIDLPMSVVVVSYNSRELLRACLASVESEQFTQIIVIDNASSDGSDEMVARDFPGVSLVKSKKNDGYGAAANLAIAGCSSKYILLLNCDTLLLPGTLQSLCDYLDQHPEAAILGPSLANPDGTRQASCFPFPTPLHVLVRESGLSKIWVDNLSMGSPDSARDVPWVLGAALAIRRQAFESVSGFERAFFMYYEEVDLCYRLNKSGWQTHFTPAARVIHIGGASTIQQRTAMQIQLYKSLCHFYQRHYSRKMKFQLRLVLTYLMLRNIAREILRLAHRTRLHEGCQPVDNLRVWSSVLSNVWSTNGWLSY
jgi:GT2 family glycosyltransferase